MSVKIPKVDSLIGSAPAVKIVVSSPPIKPQPTDNKITPSVNGCCAAEMTAWDENLLALDGFPLTGRPPDHIIMSPGVDVTIVPLERV